MKKVILLALIIIIIVLTAAGGCGKKKQIQEKNRFTTEAAAEVESDVEKETIVGFLYIGPIGENGWSFSHNEGRSYLEHTLKIKTLYKECVPATEEAKEIVKAMIEQGATVIFATSTSYTKVIKELAAEYPDIIFMNCGGTSIGKNLGTYFGKIEEARFLSGVVAGLKTKSNKIGYIAPYSIGEIVKGINAFTLGVKAVNPSAKVYVNWSHVWYDKVKEKSAAMVLINQGVDVITQHQDTNAVIKAAAEKEVWSIGYNSNINSIPLKTYLAGTNWNWGKYYVKVVSDISDGKWTSNDYNGKISDGIVSLNCFTTNTPAEIVSKVKEYETLIKNGSYKIFQGPIKNQNGKIIVEAGKEIDGKVLNNFNWFVEGVEGKIEIK